MNENASIVRALAALGGCMICRGKRVTLLRIAPLVLLLGTSACTRSAPPDAAARTSPAPAASAGAQALVGQWRNANGTWRFQANGTFWFMGGTTIQANPSGLNVPRTETL